MTSQLLWASTVNKSRNFWNWLCHLELLTTLKYCTCSSEEESQQNEVVLDQAITSEDPESFVDMSFDFGEFEQDFEPDPNFRNSIEIDTDFDIK